MLVVPSFVVIIVVVNATRGVDRNVLWMDAVWRVRPYSHDQTIDADRRRACGQGGGTRLRARYVGTGEAAMRLVAGIGGAAPSLKFCDKADRAVFWSSLSLSFVGIALWLLCSISFIAALLSRRDLCDSV
jgi:hypothetical protein